MFWDCNRLTSIVIPGSVTEIGESAFSGCGNLTDISLPDGLTKIGPYAFYECYDLASISIPDSVAEIGNVAFYGCSSLTGIAIPYGVTSIEDLAFDGCSNLTSISIPGSVTSIGASAFDGCGALRDVYYGGTAEQWAAITVEDGNEPLQSAAVHCAARPAVPVESVALDQTSLELLTGASAVLTASVRPDEAALSPAAWTSSDPRVASVSGGTVAAVGEGTAVITATAGGKSASCTVTVRNTPTASAVIQNPGQERTVVKTALFGGGGLPEDARVIAVIPGQGAPSRTAIGRPSNGGYVIFDTRLVGDWKLFFLDGKTLAPLARPAMLE